MAELLAAVSFAAFAWWFGTGLLFMAGARGVHGRYGGFAAATFGFGAALIGAAAVAQDASPAAAYLAFLCGLMAWAWNEAAFILGVAVGPRRIACPPEARGLRRFKLAFAALAHHELMIVATGLVLLVISWGAPNQLAFWVFALLWLMRVSAKLNLFFGAPNFSDALFPAELSHLKSYFGPRRLNAFLPISLIAITALAGAFFFAAAAPQAAPYMVVAAGLLGAMAALAAIEHAFLIIPWRDDMLWRWMTRPAARPANDVRPHIPPMIEERRQTRSPNSRRPA